MYMISVNDLQPNERKFESRRQELCYFFSQAFWNGLIWIFFGFSRWMVWNSQFSSMFLLVLTTKAYVNSVRMRILKTGSHSIHPLIIARESIDFASCECMLQVSKLVIPEWSRFYERPLRQHIWTVFQIVEKYTCDWVEMGLRVCKSFANIGYEYQKRIKNYGRGKKRGEFSLNWRDFFARCCFCKFWRTQD